MRYLDTSILGSYYYPERRSSRVQELLNQWDDPAISTLSEVEFVSMTGQLVRASMLKPKHAALTLEVFERHVKIPRYRILPVTAGEFVRAAGYLMAFDVPLRTLDALHLSIAAANACQLITADRELATAAKHHGVDCLLIA